MWNFYSRGAKGQKEQKLLLPDRSAVKYVGGTSVVQHLHLMC